jgi:hypothetical protein
MSEALGNVSELQSQIHHGRDSLGALTAELSSLDGAERDDPPATSPVPIPPGTRRTTDHLESTHGFR